MSLREEYEKQLRKGKAEDRQLAPPLYETILNCGYLCPDGAEACARRLREVFGEAVRLVEPSRWQEARLAFDTASVETVEERDSGWGFRSWKHLEYRCRQEYIQLKGPGGELGMAALLTRYRGESYCVPAFGKERPRGRVEELRRALDAYYDGIGSLAAGSRRYVLLRAGEVLGGSTRHELILFGDGNLYQEPGEIPGYLDGSLYRETERAAAKLLADLNR